MNEVIKIDEARNKNHLGEMVRSTVEQTLNDMLNAEADQLYNARRYGHTDSRPSILQRPGQSQLYQPFQLQAPINNWASD